MLSSPSHLCLKNWKSRRFSLPTIIQTRVALFVDNAIAPLYTTRTGCEYRRMSVSMSIETGGNVSTLHCDEDRQPDDVPWIFLFSIYFFVLGISQREA
jgi:hypothetical protein